jgi:hypothetical protein
MNGDAAPTASACGRAETALPWLLRAGVALCFVGHGAFGLMTKQAWVPYFAVAGIGETGALKLMPWIGAMDVMLGVLALLWPCRALFAWAAAWTIWTALLRPFAGQGWPEFFERAGNYGPPIAILVIIGWRTGWFARLPARRSDFSDLARGRLAWTLRLTTATLLAGHAGCALLLHKAALAHHYAIFTTKHPATAMAAVGWLELALAFAVLFARGPAVFVAVCAWKVATESLFFMSGAIAPLFELIERSGSYVAPLALAWLLARSSVPSWSRIPQSSPPSLSPC